MNFLLFLLLITHSVPSNTLFDFNKKSELKKWVVVDDVVMGGRSSGSFGISPKGHGMFKGSISLDNNGGFSSVRHNFERKSVKDFSKIVLRIKGDSKNYQLRIKLDAGDYFSYVKSFSTTGDWQEVEIQLEDMYPSFFGRKLDQPNFSADYIEELALLIGNKRQEDFQLLIDSIKLK